MGPCFAEVFALAHDYMSLAGLTPREVEAKLLDAINVHISKSTLHRAKINSRQKPLHRGRVRCMPPELECMIAKNIRATRRLKCPGHKFEIIERANELIKDTPVQKRLKDGVVSSNWYYSFLTEHNLSMT